MSKVDLYFSLCILKKQIKSNKSVILYNQKFLIRLNKPLHFLIILISLTFFNYFLLYIFSYKFKFLVYFKGLLMQ